MRVKRFATALLAAVTGDFNRFGCGFLGNRCALGGPALRLRSETDRAEPDSPVPQTSPQTDDVKTGNGLNM